MEPCMQDTIEARMASRAEHPVLALRHDLEERTLRYAVGASSGHPTVYSIYVEYSEGSTCSTELIPAFSKDRDVAESFCAILARYSATPLSLYALYEDSLTP